MTPEAPGAAEAPARPGATAAPPGPPAAPGPRLRALLRSPRTTLLVPVLLAAMDSALVAKGSEPWQLALSALSVAVLLLRRRFPLTVALLTLPGAFFNEIWLAPLTAVYSVAAARPRPPVPVACATAFALVEFFHWPFDPGLFALSRDNALYAIQSVMLGAGPAALGMLVRTRGELAERVTELTAGRQRESRLLAEKVLAAERARLAREMHDVVSHQVSLISIQAGALQVASTDPAARDGARTIRELSVRTLDELRQMVGVLRAAGVPGTPLAPQPTLADLPRLIDGSGLAVTRRLDPGRRNWPEAVERAAYRTVQEGLTNISKHAPGAPVTVRVTARGGRLHVEVRNGPPPLRPAGAGQDTAPLPGGGHGLIGLRERAALLGGTFTAAPTPDGGFALHAVLPAP
ncbi:sensor histidine kinase [Kitasatospora cineracea]|uniref:histidine kinase n=1 Tax=Kitasatospora cineracea TaxID=88074 RepID=A0A3N4RS50_9ACTN|nr:histidine kinase [Kitasatospora cineracea]RPE33555.1 signal transduction histidine kinase [Kitasatospora cineracea]